MKQNQYEIYAAEEECKAAHRALGIKKAKGIATKADYRRAELAAKAMEKAHALNHQN